MPDRLCDRTSVRILKWFTTIDASEGVGAKHEHTTIRMSICARANTFIHRPDELNLAMDIAIRRGEVKDMQACPGRVH